MNTPTKQGNQGGQNQSLDLSGFELISDKNHAQQWDISRIEKQDDPTEKFIHEEESELYSLEQNSNMASSLVKQENALLEK